MSDEKLKTVLAQIDAYNAQDPNRETFQGVSEPHELVYSRRLTNWVLKLKPDASELLRIVARGQHIGRWTSARDRYPMDRGGYLRWREDLKKFHAKTVGEIMTKNGYAAADAERVQMIILKKNLASDPDVQTIEDALCLVFLETQFDELKEKTPDEKMKDIVRKTWKKMSEKGRAAALAMDLPSAEKIFLLETLR